MSELKYKIGDRVRIKSIDWYNENKDKDGVVELSTHVFVPGMSYFCGKVVTIKDIFEDMDDDVAYYTEEMDFDLTDEMIEGLVEEKVSLKLTGKAIKNNEMAVSVSEYILPEGYIIKDENGNVINATKIILEKEKKEYPKTYEECCDVLSIQSYYKLRYYTYEHDYNEYATSNKLCSLSDKLNILGKLLICRDAYWKIAGEEMELGKPWEPDWKSLDPQYVILYQYGGIDKAETHGEGNYILTFPTAEMRDAFYKNFKREIEECKELL